MRATWLAVLCLIAGSEFTGQACAQAALSVDVRADILTREIVESAKNGKTESALDKISEYRALEREGHKTPPPMLFMEAKLASVARQHDRAVAALTSYFTLAERSDRNYAEALVLMTSEQEYAKNDSMASTRNEINKAIERKDYVAADELAGKVSSQGKEMESFGEELQAIKNRIRQERERESAKIVRNVVEVIERNMIGFSSMRVSLTMPAGRSSAGLGKAMLDGLTLGATHFLVPDYHSVTTNQEITVSAFKISRRPILVEMFPSVCGIVVACTHGTSGNFTARESATLIAWLNQYSNKHYRLPTLAEWVGAASADGTTDLPWGSRKMTKIKADKLEEAVHSACQESRHPSAMERLGCSPEVVELGFEWDGDEDKRSDNIFLNSRHGADRIGAAVKLAIPEHDYEYDLPWAKIGGSDEKRYGLRLVLN